MARPRMGQHDRRGILVFLAIAFGLAWIPFVPALLGGDPVGVFLMPVAPAIAAIVVRRWVTREGFADAGLRPNLRRWPLYVLAATWPILATMVSVPLAFLFGAAPDGFTMPWGMATPDLLTVVGWLLISIAISPIIFGEELGWRGYLQIRLFADQPWLAAIATGLIWGVWHYPMLLADESIDNHLFWLLDFPLATTIMSVFLGWLRARTGDVWSTSVGHAANNVTENSWHRQTFTGDSGGTPAASGDATVVVAEAIVLVGLVVASGLRRQRSVDREPAFQDA
jgi:uncharacterized protein